MKCWICNLNEANSGEHKFKSSQLRLMHGRRFEKSIMFVSEGKALRLEGPNNKKVKFPKVICEHCNNTTTSPHDFAFDELIKWSNENYASLFETKNIDFKQVYGEGWLEQKRNLYKYLAKHAGCKILTGDYENDLRDLSKFIYDNADPKSFQIKFVVKEGFNFLDRLLKVQKGKGVNFMSNSSTVCRTNKDLKMVYYAGQTTYNWLSISWVYTQNGFETKLLGINRRYEPIEFLPFGDSDEKVDNWHEEIDKQGLETMDKQVDYFDTFVS